MAATIIKLPVIEHKVSLLRDKNTTSASFRKIVQEIGGLMTYEITRDFPLVEKEVETPVAKTNAKFLGGKKTVIVPILRAGLGMVDGIMSILPNSRIGHIGLYRDEETLQAIEYFAKFPSNLEEREILLVDPMLATGATAVAAIDILKRNGAKSIRLVCLVGVQEGIDVVEAAHPEVDIFLGAKDEKLNEIGYIVPGLGDAGDRIFGTK
ncbi:MAG: uracil phosphoribosyltransferase [Spiroplasma sp.]|nr:uracil phosphoribosyltransferase [Mycoplasmatales bacterium]